MRRDHRPLYIRRARAQLDQLFARRFLHPHFDAVGEGCQFTSPWHVQVFGPCIELGKHVSISAMAHHEVRLSVWSAKPGLGRIRIGDYSVINPGARISSTCGIEIGNNALFASNVYLSDGDSHGLYDRVYNLGAYAPIKLEDNVWLGESVIVCKGVTIGENSIVGAGAVVVKDIPKNCVAVGNPARPVRELDPKISFVSRQSALADFDRYVSALRENEAAFFSDNTLRGWLRYLIAPRRGD